MGLRSESGEQEDRMGDDGEMCTRRLKNFSQPGAGLEMVPDDAIVGDFRFARMRKLPIRD